MDGAAAHVVTFGTVAAIEGARARVVLDMAEDGSGFAGPVPPQIGQVVRVDVGEARVFGVIIGLRTPAAEQAIIGPPNQIMDLDLIGEILETDANARFRRGVSEFPRLGDRVSAAGSDDLRKIFTRTDREGVRVGCVHQDPSLPANIFTDDLLASTSPCSAPRFRASRARSPLSCAASSALASTATSSIPGIRTGRVSWRRSANWRTSSARQSRAAVLAAQLRRDEGADHRRVEPHAGKSTPRS